jgi:hypothetical protein
VCHFSVSRLAKMELGFALREFRMVAENENHQSLILRGVWLSLKEPLVAHNLIRVEVVLALEQELRKVLIPLLEFQSQSFSY